MAERFSLVKERIDSVSQLSSVVAAIRGIAAARLREGVERLDGVRAYAEAVGLAIGEALSLVAAQDSSSAERPATGRSLVIALCSEQGFVGGYNSRILAVSARLAKAPGAELFIIGDHGRMVAEECGLQVAWSAPMAVHVAEANGLSNRLADILYDRVQKGVALAVIVHASPDATGEQRIVEHSLLPFDFSRFPAARRDQPPLLTLPPEKLLAQLVEEYVFAELCEAVVLAFAAENEVRMRTMISAHENVAKRLEQLQATARRSRQEEITSEVVELASGVEAGRGKNHA